jgi:pyridoxamine 5'-phosphate oxidase family protein
MSIFTPAEIVFLQGHRLGRMATVNARGEPHVVPVRFRYDAARDAIELGGRGMGASKKYRDAASGRPVAFVVDGRTPDGTPCGVEVRATAEALATGGEAIWPDVDPQFLRLRPRRVVAWGIETPPDRPNARNI